MTREQRQGWKGQDTSLNVREQVIADPSLHFPVMNKASSREHPRQVTVAGPQPAYLHQPIVHDALYNNSATALLYPGQYQQRTARPSSSHVTQLQQQIDIHPQVRTSTSQMAQPQQQVHLHPQVRPNTSQMAQSQQQMYLYSQVRPSTSQMAQSQQQMDFHLQKRLRILQMAQLQQHIHLPPQVRTSTSQIAQSQIHLHPQVRTSTSQVVQTPQQLHLHPQVRTSTSQVVQSQQQIHLHPQVRTSTSQAVQTPQQLHLHPQQAVQTPQQLHLHPPLRRCTSRVAPSEWASVTVPRVYDTQQPHFIPVSHFTNSNRTDPSMGLVEREDPKSKQRFREWKRAFLRDRVNQVRRYRETYLRLGASPRVNQDSSRRGNAGNGAPSSVIAKPTLPAESSHGHSSRSVLYDLPKPERTQISRDVPFGSVHAPHPTHAESRVGNSASQFPAQTTRDDGFSQRSTSLGDCGGYAVDHESFPIIVAVHSAGAHGKDDVPTPGSPSRCPRQETPQHDNDDVMITKVTFQGSESSPTSPVKRSSPIHGNSQSKKLCIEPSPHFEQPPNFQEASQSLHTQEPCQENHGTFQQFAPTIDGSAESCQTPEQTNLPPQAQESGDASSEVNNQTPSPPANGYLNVQDFFDSHIQTASKQAQESSMSPTAAAVELDFGGPPPYLPLREPCEETNQTACSWPSGAAPQQHRGPGVTRIYRVRNASQDQETSEGSERHTETHRSIESHHSSERSEERPPKTVYTLELLCSKILHTRERIKNEQIPWKKKVLYRLEAMFIKRLVRMEAETGRKADIDIPREDLLKKKAKRRNSRLSSDKKELGNAGSGEARNSSVETAGKEEDPQKSPVGTNVKQVENCGGDNAKPGMNRSTNSQEMTRQNKSQDKLDVGCPEMTRQNKNQDKLDVGCPEMTTQDKNQDKLDVGCPEMMTQDKNQDKFDVGCPEMTTQNKSQDKLDVGCPEMTTQDKNQDKLDVGCPEMTTQNKSQGKLDVGCPEMTRQNKNQDKLDAVCHNTGNTGEQTDVHREPDGSLHKQSAQVPIIKGERRRTFSCDKSTGIKRAVIKPYLYEKHEGAMKDRVADQRETADKPKGHSAENVPSITCQDACSPEEKSKDKSGHDETLPFKTKSSPTCNRNIWSFLKTFTE